MWTLRSHPLRNDDQGPVAQYNYRARFRRKTSFDFLYSVFACLYFDMADIQNIVSQYSDAASQQFQKVPGSAILLRYIRSSYQNDPVRSAIELFLFLFAVGYLLSPKYETKDKNKIKLTEDVRLAQCWRIV